LYTKAGPTQSTKNARGGTEVTKVGESTKKQKRGKKRI